MSLEVIWGMSAKMATRTNPYHSSNETMQAVVALDTYVQSCGLELGLLDLIKTRASQINGCVFCIDMHTREARARRNGAAPLSFECVA